MAQLPLTQLASANNAPVILSQRARSALRSFQTDSYTEHHLGRFVDLRDLYADLRLDELLTLRESLHKCREDDHKAVKELTRKLGIALKDYDESRDIQDIGRQDDDVIQTILRGAKQVFGRKTPPTTVPPRRPAFSDGMVARYLVANTGGAVLLIPMIIMVFAESKTAHLIVTSLFVLGFAFMVSVGARASNQELLGTTAAYAAVLVVYVGASAPS